VRIDDSLNLLRAAGSEAILVALSGGKDSIVTLDLCKKVFPRVEAFFMYYVKDLRCIDERLDYLQQRYDIEIHKVPHFNLAQAYRAGSYMPRNEQARRWTKTKLKDIEGYVKNQTGIEWIAYGWRKTDCFERRAILSRNGGMDEKNHHIYPIAEWRVGEIRNYLDFIGIPLPQTVGKSFDICPNYDSMNFLKQHYPDDYERFIEKFPFLEVTIKREEFRRAQIDKDAEV
jgi:phosphoadenosine phosphosulfate reductase